MKVVVTLNIEKKLYNRIGAEIYPEKEICAEIDGQKVSILTFEIDSSNKAFIYSNDENCKKISPIELKNKIDELYFILTDNFVTPVSKSEIINSYLKLDNEKILVKDVEPIIYNGNISFDDPISYDICIESPVRNACKILNSLGIKTIMSGCNKNNVNSKNKPSSDNLLFSRAIKLNLAAELKNKKVYDTKYGVGNDYFFGNGFAWIAIDWDKLSEENKEILIGLNNGTEPVAICENGVSALKDNCKVNDTISSQSILFDFFETISITPSRPFEEPLSIYRRFNNLLEKKDNYDIIYDGISSILVNNNSFYKNGIHYRTAILKYPINENTTIEEVDQYFCCLLRKFKYNNYHYDNEQTSVKVL